MVAMNSPNKFTSDADMMGMPSGCDLERMDEVQKIKEQANGKFREGDYFSAKCLYSGALEMLERCCLHMEKSENLWEGIKNNMALCDFKRQEWTRVVEATSEILTRNPSNTKALYRRGVAKAGQGKLKEAQRDLRLAVELEPENLDARQKFSEVVEQIKSNKTAEKEQADKMRGFLWGERLADTVPISEDGGVRKLHGNENAPLYSSWMKRAWLSPQSGLVGVVTVHIVIKTPAGKEVFSTRKPLGSVQQQPFGSGMGGSSRAAGQPVAPARWVVDDCWGNVFQAWNVAVKTMQLYEVARFEALNHTLGPSVEAAIQKCIGTWLANMPALKDAPEDVQMSVKRRQALQILGLPDDFCLEPVQDSKETLSMEMELLEVNEFKDVKDDGRYLLCVLRDGKSGTGDAPVVEDLSAVTAHFRFSKLLTGSSLKDTRVGLASSTEGLVMRHDATKEPIEFIVGEEMAPTEMGEFVPPCLGQCLLLPPDGVKEGMQFEVILRDGVPLRDMEKTIYNAYLDGTMDSMPDTTGPVCIRVEVERVVRACAGPSTPGWKGVESIVRERHRALELESLDEGRHRRKALKRWQRIISWLEALLRGRRWKVQGSSTVNGVGSMYDLEWDDEGEDEEGDGGEKRQNVENSRLEFAPSERTSDACPAKFTDEMLKQLQEDELHEWATAHVAAAKLLEDSAPNVCQRHARCAIQACSIGSIPKELEISARCILGNQLLAGSGSSAAEALEVLKVAQALDPTSQQVRNLSALALQKDADNKSVDMKSTLQHLKKRIADSLASDVDVLQKALEEIDSLPLTWEVANETAIGKEVGKCAKHCDQIVSERAKAIIAKLHKLAKEQRPLWVR